MLFFLFSVKLYVLFTVKLSDFLLCLLMSDSSLLCYCYYCCFIGSILFYNLLLYPTVFFAIPEYSLKTFEKYRCRYMCVGVVCEEYCIASKFIYVFPHFRQNNFHSLSYCVLYRIFTLFPPLVASSTLVSSSCFLIFSVTYTRVFYLPCYILFWKKYTHTQYFSSLHTEEYGKNYSFLSIYIRCPSWK